MILVEEVEARAACESALMRAGVPASHARLQADVLIDAELRGVPSHGLLRLKRIIARIGNGVIDPVSRGFQQWSAEGFLTVDGQGGLGPVVASAALAALQARVERLGIAIAAIRNSNHLGMLGWYAEEMAKQGYALIAFSTSEALVHPWGARHAMIGTNPIAIAVPTKSQSSSTAPFMMDTATSIVSMGEVHDHALRGAAIPSGWALDADGNPTQDAAAATRGAIAPFGQAKGYAMGLAFELLVARLTGAALGRAVGGTLDDDQMCNKGDLFILIRGEGQDLHPHLDTIRAMPPAQGFDRVQIPGERGRAAKAERLASGIPLPANLWETVQALARSAEEPERS